MRSRIHEAKVISSTKTKSLNRLMAHDTPIVHGCPPPPPPHPLSPPTFSRRIYAARCTLSLPPTQLLVEVCEGYLPNPKDLEGQKLAKTLLLSEGHHPQVDRLIQHINKNVYMTCQRKGYCYSNFILKWHILYLFLVYAHTLKACMPLKLVLASLTHHTLYN